MSRLEQLQKLAKAQPEDPFAHFAVGLELMEQERYAEALAIFEHTLALDPDYIAAVFLKAKVEVRLGRKDAAVETLRVGVATAQRLGDTHTESKMRQMLEMLT